MAMETAPNRPLPPERDERSIGDLLGELASETTTLVHQEITLAKAELNEKVSTVGKNVAAVGVGGAVLYAGMLTLIAGIVLALAQWRLLEPWASALIIGILVVIVGALMVKKGMDSLQHLDPVPHQTVQTLKDDKEWVKEQVQ